MIPGVRVYTNPDVLQVPGAGWDHVSLHCWGDAVALWDRDCSVFTLNSIHVWNGDRHPSLWCGIDEVDSLYGRRSNVVKWCRLHHRWELAGGHRDCHLTESWAWWLRVGYDAFARRNQNRSS